MSSGTNKLAAERNQRILIELASKPGNDICADCKTRNPRWASFNLGIFICVGCASIHRKIGTHISKVKSLTLDSWSKEQVDRMKEMGNVKSNAIYNPNEVRNPPPPRLDDPARDNDLEQYIRSKYEYRRFLDKNALVASKLGPSRSASSVIPHANSTSQAPLAKKSVQPTPEPKTATEYAATMFSTTKPQLQPRSTASQLTQPTSQSPPTRSISQPVLSQSSSQPVSAATKKPEGVWADLISLQEPSANASLPLQYQATAPTYNGLTASSTTPAGLSGSFVNMTMTGLPAGNPSLNPFPQQSFATNPFAQQALSAQTPTSAFPASTSGLQMAAPTGFNQPNSSLFQTQMQPQAPSVPFYHPQPQASSLAPSQSHPQFLSSSPNPQLVSSSPNPQFFSPSPNAQFVSSHSPQLQSTTSNATLHPGFASSPAGGVGVGYMTPSPQPVMNTMMQPGTFGSGFGQPQQVVTTSNPFGQTQFAQGGFPGQQWGPL